MKNNITQETINKIAIEAEIRFLQKNRKNFSAQADAVIDKLKKQGTLRDSDYFIMFNTDEKQIAQAIELDYIKDRMGNGRLRHKDIDFLINTLGDVGEFDSALRKSFYQKADEINLAYAQTHPEEFTEQEIRNLTKQVGNKSVQNIIKEELEKI